MLFESIPFLASATAALLAISTTIVATNSMGAAVTIGTVVAAAVWLLTFSLFPEATRGGVGLSRIYVPKAEVDTQGLFLIAKEACATAGLGTSGEKTLSTRTYQVRRWRVDRSMYLRVTTFKRREVHLIQIQTEGRANAPAHQLLKGAILTRLRESPPR